MFGEKLSSNLLFAAILIALSGALVWARHAGIVGPEPVRGAMAIVGIILAAQANFIPKMKPTASPKRRAIDRFAGRAFLISGAAYALIWCFAPIAIAADLSIAACVLSIVTVLAYCLWQRRATA